MAVLDSDHAAVLLIDDEVCRGRSELRGQHSVIRARRAASLIMSGNGDACLLAESRLDLRGDLVGYRRVLRLLAAAAAFLLCEYLIVDALCTLCNGED